ncbi:hypothetical protein HHI36_023517 [Cryptolaemus montrouzieri]|uniref:Fibronectin type-III domain-containing protein n=1 Tax=Cryptolaemus montrouzieri TaxID=559131 RepID=A0ABD2PH96_9CUCU
MGVLLDTTLPKFIIFIFLLLLCEKLVLSREECTPGVKWLGYTRPKGDVVLEYGNPLDIYCVLHEEEASKIGENASQYLAFKRSDKLLSREMVQVINSTTVKLHIENLEKTSAEHYSCILKNFTEEVVVCMNFVDIGVRPQPVNDFKCISNNLDNLTCKWTAPENYVETNYNLSYSEMNTFRRYSCPAIEGRTVRSCTWSLSTDPIYRQSVPDYIFYLSMSNILGNYSMPPKHFKHFENVIPNAPEHLKKLFVSSNYVNLSWTIPTTMQTFSKGLANRIIYQSSYGKKEWQTREQIYVKNVQEVTYTLDNLEYAHAYYDIRVAIRSNVSNPNDESMWSNYTSITVLTASKKPDGPPRTTVGSFEILTYGGNSERNVRIYWSHIDEERRNGEKFKYEVELEGSTEKNTTENAYMLFEHLSASRSYTFRIWARNEMGSSDRYSIVKVPAHKDYISEPSKLIKEELGDGHYRFSWQPPQLELSQRIRNYTIFWCNDERDKPPCSGKLDWEIVPATLNSFNKSIPSNKTYQFGISANTFRGSSGMVWAQCTDLLHKYSVGKINDFVRLELGSNWISLKWTFGCSGKRVTGFIVYYCPITSLPKDDKCKEPEKNITTSSDENSVTIEGLTPYTTYSAQVAAIINHTTYSQRSAKVYATTLEAAPSTPPTYLKITNVTNSTITITWEPPSITNGILKGYKITYNNNTKRIDPTTSVTLTNLISYKDYMISIQACTTKCSQDSQILHVQTKIGYPSVIREPSITQNATYTGIKWDKPKEPNGRNERYELRIKEKHDSENVTSVINTTDREWGIYNCGKEKKYNSFYVSVRAVNIENGKIYPGKWSDEIEYYCTSSSNYIIYILVPVIILFLLAMTYLFKKMYGHFEEMRDVGVKLPQGLQGEVTETEINLSSWTQKSGNDDGDHAADDEEHLLMKKNDGSPNLNGDSSGCSSAREGSVSCSVDTASNISSSTSDSGTEQPRTPSTEDLSEPAVTTSLRQRNIRPPLSKPYVPLPLDPSNSGGAKLAPRSYCVLGVDPTTNTESVSTYIPIPSMSDKAVYGACESPHSPPYVMTGELVKTANPNYIPYKASLPTEIASKNTAYVTAGNKDLLAPDVMSIESNKPMASQDSTYIKNPDNIALKSADISIRQPPLSTNTKTGYVSIGDASSIKKEPKGYVPHRQFESKALKED